MVGPLDGGARAVAENLARLDGANDSLARLQKLESRLQKLLDRLEMQQTQLDALLQGEGGGLPSPSNGATAAPQRSPSQWRDAMQRFLSDQS